MKTPLSSASIYLGANVLNAAIPFLLLPVLTRVLSPADYGRVALFEAVVACLAAFTGLSTHGAVSVSYFRDDRSGFAEYVGTCLLILIGSATAAAAVVVLLGALGVDLAPLGIEWVLFAVLVSFAQFLLNIRLVIWQCCDRPVRYGTLQVLQTLFNALLSLFLVVYLTYGSAGRIMGLGIASIVAGAIALASMQAGRWIRWHWNRDAFLDAIRFGLPLIPHALGTLAVAFSDRFIIAQSLGVRATGLYFAAVQLAAPMLLLGSSFNRAFVPWLFARLSSGENTKAVAMSYAAVAGFLIAGVCYGLLLHLGLTTILGEQYHQSRLLALILVVGTSFQAAYYAVVNYIFYAKRTLQLSVVTFLSGLLYVAGAWIIAPRYGLLGMAVLFSLVQCMTFVLVWMVSSRVSPQPWVDLPSVRRELLNLAR